MLQLVHVKSAEEIEVVRNLLREYQKELGIDLGFQGFDAEVDGLPGAYTSPSGRLLLAQHEGAAVGCIALQQVNASRCEMKRLYVRPCARGLGVARTLIDRVLGEAKAIGYAEVALDTLPTMIEAQQLYRQFGFHDIAPYRANPILGTRYMGKKL